MADKNFGVRQINLINPSGTPTITSPNNLNLNALTVAIGTDLSIGGKLIVGLGSTSGPSIFPTGDNNTGIFFPSSDTVCIGIAGTERIRVGAGGSVGIGTSSPQTDLHIHGTVRNTARFAASTQTALHINTTTGDIAETASSRRFKRNIEDYEKGLETLVQLRPVSFQFLEDDLPNTGLIAEEVNELGLPEFIRYDENGNPYSIPYDNLSALFINAIKELKAENDLLRARLDAAGL